MLVVVNSDLQAVLKRNNMTQDSAVSSNCNMDKAEE